MGVRSEKKKAKAADQIGSEDWLDDSKGFLPLVQAPFAGIGAAQPLNRGLEMKPTMIGVLKCSSTRKHSSDCPATSGGGGWLQVGAGMLSGHNQLSVRRRGMCPVDWMGWDGLV